MAGSDLVEFIKYLFFCALFSLILTIILRFVAVFSFLVHNTFLKTILSSDNFSNTIVIKKFSKYTVLF